MKGNYIVLLNFLQYKFVCKLLFCTVSFKLIVGICIDLIPNFAARTQTAQDEAELARH